MTAPDRQFKDPVRFAVLAAFYAAFLLAAVVVSLAGGALLFFARPGREKKTMMKMMGDDEEKLKTEDGERKNNDEDDENKERRRNKDNRRMAGMIFPKGFLWGTAASAYQIEGAVDEDGRGPSIWDEFVKRRGRIADGSDGRVACDHYHRFREDLALVKALNVKAYRFSVQWPRILPEGTGAVNPKGLDFYDRLVDCVLENGLEPFLGLYHWELPLALHRRGGWTNPESAGWFERYAEVAVRRFGDRVRFWEPIIEPLVVFVAYITGFHAPGGRSFRKAVKAAHNLLLAFARSFRAIKAHDGGLQVGLVESLQKVYPARPRDEAAVGRVKGFLTSLFTDPVLKGRYPERLEPVLRFWNRRIQDADFDLIKTPIDFLGVNNYTRHVVKRTVLPVSVPGPGCSFAKPDYPGVEFTQKGWEVYPQGLSDILTDVKNEYGNPRVFVTENGAAYLDEVTDGRIHDGRRIGYLRRHIEKVGEAIRDGCDVRGYFVWSFLDNFEWEAGYTQRFGLYYVDYATQRRILKDSGRWYAAVCARDGLAAEETTPQGE
jgi:beta-glucosidase